MIREEQFKKVKSALNVDEDMLKHVNKLLKNTELANTNISNLSIEAVDRAYKFAKTNLIVMNEVGIPFTPLYKNSILRRKMDSQLVNLVEAS